MFPLFGGHQRRREINLGGLTSVSSQATILEQAKTRRLEREALRKREDSAVKIQSWWRGTVSARETRWRLRQLFQEDISSLTGLRCLFLIGQDEDLLGQWSTVMSKDKCVLSRAIVSQDKDHWVVLLCRISKFLLRSVGNAPSSPFATAHLQVLCLMLTPSTTPTVVDSASGLSSTVIPHVMRSGFYENIHRALTGIAPDSKDHPALPYLINLAYLPFANTSPSSNQFTQYLQSFIIHTLSIPLLPYRIPLKSLTQLSGQLPLEHLYTLTPCIADVVAKMSTPAQINLAANLLVFVPPSRYASIPVPSLTTFIGLLSVLFSALPPGALDSDLALKTGATWEDDGDHPSEDVALQSIFSALDTRIQKKLQESVSSIHLNSLLKLTQQYPQLLSNVLGLLMILNISWPTVKDKVLGTLILYGGGGIVRQIYREHVRESPLGRGENFIDPQFKVWWPPLLLLTDLYTHTLRTMWDDEFFSGPRALLSLNELISFSRTLFNIAFVLYWRDDMCSAQGTNVPGLNLRWVNVRERITKCLLAIHARDSRRPFMPKDHWHLDSQINMDSFIEAAVYDSEEEMEMNGSLRGSKHHPLRLSPHLGILDNIPFAIPFETRVHIFRRFIESDMEKHSMGFRRFPYHHHGRIELDIRRGHIAQDGYDKLSGVDLREPIAITFIDQFGEPEAGIDGGGVFKEFFTSLCKEVFDAARGLWLENKKNEIYPSPLSYAKEPHSLSWYRFIGRILGKALYDGILVEVAFAGFFLAKCLGKESFLDDLASLDPEFYQGLVFLKNYTGNVEDLSLNFTAATEEFGVTKVVDLIPNGSNVPMTRDNRLQYIYRISHYRLTKQIKLQSEAFLEGLSQIIDPKWLRMFNQQELQILLGGVNTLIDLGDLREHTQYGGVYNNDDPTIQAFWKVMETFDQEERRAFLRFVTSCSRPPLLGFEQLSPNFAIRDAGSDQHRLPTASTCVNLLKLPRYTNERVLKQKLLQAISSGAGFDLS